MDISTAIGLLFGLLTLAGTVFGVVKSYGVLQQTVKDQVDKIDNQAVEMDKLENRMDKAEQTAQQVNNLANAVEHMSDRFVREISNLADQFKTQNEHTKEILTDLKDRLNK